MWLDIYVLVLPFMEKHYSQNTLYICQECRKQYLIGQAMKACIRSDHSYSTWIVSNNMTDSYGYVTCTHIMVSGLQYVGN